MIKKVVKYYGEQIDEFGMPTPYYSYLIVSSEQKNMNNTAIATAISISGNSPAPNPPHCAYTPSVLGVNAVEGAFNEMLNRLGKMEHLNGHNLIRDEIEFSA